MKPQTVSVTGAGTSDPVKTDLYALPQLALQVNVSGTVNYTIQQTLDDPESASANWFSHPDSNLVAQTVTRQGNYAYLPRGVRILQNSGAGTTTLIVIQPNGGT